MERFRPGDEVRVDIPDETDPDFEEYHDRRGEVVEIEEDELGFAIGDERDNVIYRVQFPDGEEMDFRWRDLRPA